jgi:hypothetical protein
MFLKSTCTFFTPYPTTFYGMCVILGMEQSKNHNYRIFLPAEALFILRAVFSHLYGFGNQEVQILPT